MVVKVFVLGLPGCGKSTAIRHLNMLARDCEWKTYCINDYDLLYDMYMADTEQKQFSSADYGGFDVRDLSVFDTVLLKLEQEAIALEQKNVFRSHQIIFIEFSRNDYCQALKHFSAPFLKDAFFLFVRATIPACKCRIQERVARRQGEEDRDNHFVSEYIFDTYYKYDSGNYPIYMLNGQQDYRGIQYVLKEENIQVVDNTTMPSIERFETSLNEAWKKIEQAAAYNMRIPVF